MTTFLYKQVRRALLALLVMMTAPASLIAQNKVVVIPMAGDTITKAPNFRIVPTELNNEAATSGRLEYTNAENPRSTSRWGKVCDDCFEGPHGDCPTATTTTPESAATAICRDLGFESGTAIPDGPATNTGGLSFTLDNVACPSGSESFEDCSSTTPLIGACELGDEVTVECSNEPPKVIASEFNLSNAIYTCGQDLSEDPKPILPFVRNTFQSGFDASITEGSSEDFDLWDRSVNSITFLIILRIESQSQILLQREYPCEADHTDSTEDITFAFTDATGVDWQVTATITTTTSPNAVIVSDIIIKTATE